MYTANGKMIVFDQLIDDLAFFLINEWFLHLGILTEISPPVFCHSFPLNLIPVFFSLNEFGLCKNVHGVKVCRLRSGDCVSEMLSYCQIGEFFFVYHLKFTLHACANC